MVAYEVAAIAIWSRPGTTGGDVRIMNAISGCRFAMTVAIHVPSDSAYTPTCEGLTSFNPASSFHEVR